MHPPDWHCSQMLRHAEIPIHHAGSSEGGAAMPYGMLRHAFAHARDPVAWGIAAMPDCPDPLAI